MRWEEQDTRNCSIGRTVEIIGRPWTFLLLREMFRGLRRFDQFHAHLEVSPTMLTRRLRELEEHRLVERIEYHRDGQRRRQEYQLTQRGADLWPIVTALHEWGDAHVADPEGPATVYRHQGCGASVRLHLNCELGHRLSSLAEVDVLPGPGARRPPARTSGTGRSRC